MKNFWTQRKKFNWKLIFRSVALKKVTKIWSLRTTSKLMRNISNI